MIDGILYAADQGARVLNLSFGGPAYSQLLEDACDYAHAKDAILVAAAGNENSSAPTYPAALPRVVAVAATDQSDARWPDSNHGAYVRLAAPGVGVLTTARGGGFSLATGTSVAAAHVSGVAALFLSRNHELSNTEVEDGLCGIAVDLGESGVDEFFGHGRLSAAKLRILPLKPVHDIAIERITFQSADLVPGQPVQITAVIYNQGSFVERNLRLNASVNGVQLHPSHTVVKLRPKDSTNVLFEWLPTAQPVNGETLVVRVEAGPVDGEPDTADNVKSRTFLVANEGGIVSIKHKSEPRTQTHQYLAGEAWQLLSSGTMKTEIHQYIGNKLTYSLGDDVVVTYSGKYNEDINLNGQLDEGEDVNANGVLDVNRQEDQGWAPGGIRPTVPVLYYDENRYMPKFTVNDPIDNNTGNGADNETAGFSNYPGDDIIEGVMEEDFFGLPSINPDGFPDIFYNGAALTQLFQDLDGACIFVNHFWLRPPTHNGVGESGLDSPGCKDNPTNAYALAQRYWDFAAVCYPTNKELAYYHLGRVAHLLLDMTVPAHAHGDAHVPLLTGNDSYEDHMGTHYVDYTHNSNPGGMWSYELGDLKYADYATVTAGDGFYGFGTSEKRWNGSQGSWESEPKLYRLFWFTAEVADNFDSDGIDGQDTQGVLNQGIIEWDISPEGCELIGNFLMPLAMKATAELYALFWEETHAGVTVAIAGRITDGSIGAGLPNVTVTFSNGGGSAITDGNGNYSVSLPSGWAGVATPTLPGNAFTPASRDYSGGVTTDLNGQDYSRHIISPGGVKVVYTNPANGGPMVARNSDISIRFSKPMNSATLNADTIQVVGSISGPHAGVFAYDGQSYTVTFNPYVDFEADETVTVTASHAAQAQDRSTLGADYSFQFSAIGATPTPISFGGTLAADTTWTAGNVYRAVLGPDDTGRADTDD